MEELSMAEIMEKLLRLLHEIRETLNEMDITEYSGLMYMDEAIDEALNCADKISDFFESLVQEGLEAEV